MRWQYGAALVLVITLNLVLRTIWVLRVHPAPVSDFGFYYRAAEQLAAGEGYRMNGALTAYWPMGWPLALSFAFRLAGPSLAAGLGFQILASTATAALIFVLGHRITRSLLAATLAAVAWSILPGELGWTALLASEPLFALLVIAALAVFVVADGWRGYALGGVLLGVACWVRPTVLLFPVFLFLLLVSQRRGWRIAAGWTAVAAAAMILTIAPLTIRNATVFGEFIPVSTNGGVNLWQGVHTDSEYWWSTDPAVNPLVSVQDEVQRDHLGQRLFVEYALAHPVRTAHHAVLKIAALYSPPLTVWWWLDARWSASTRSLLSTLGAIAYWIFLLLAVAGVGVGLVRHRAATLLLGGFLLYYTLVFAFFPANDRFRYPLMPVFAIFVGIAVGWFFDRLGTLQWRRGSHTEDA